MTYLRGMQSYDVAFGDIVLHLSEYQITGGCLLREQGTAEGDAAVTAVYPKGTRIVLKGKISPPQSRFEAVGEALDTAVRSGAARSMRLGLLECRDLRLIGYTMAHRDITAEVTLVFYTQTALGAQEAAS